LLPQTNNTSNQSSAKDFKGDNDHSFAGMIFCTHAGLKKEGWILDSDATDHMTYMCDHLVETKKLTGQSKITLPNSQFSYISHVGIVRLTDSLLLNEVLYILSFKYNLLSVPKLTKDISCIVIFYSTF